MPDQVSEEDVRRSPGRRTLFLLRRLGFGYSCFKVFELPLDRAAATGGPALPDGYRFVELSALEVASCPFAELRECEWYGGPGSHLFGILRDDVLVCMQCLWFGERYRQKAFWPLGSDDAASVHLVTAPPERGKGLATQLKRHSAERLRDRGFAHLYSRIWWTNTASLRVSEKAGWSQVGTVLELEAPWRQEPIRRVFHRHR
ncbi:MAG TPA: GNAT family N-acetyltransferase [Casimicrobiaceae bacterium]|nr:GNAT family N-acetyltransferase [Casimicrobiaceae bacterium]